MGFSQDLKREAQIEKVAVGVGGSNTPDHDFFDLILTLENL